MPGSADRISFEGFRAMKVQIACVSLAALAAVTMQLPATLQIGMAARGSIKDMSGSAAMPVPAPVPIPDYKPSFYFRLDAGLGVMRKPSVSESGYQYGGLLSGGSYVGGKPAAVATQARSQMAPICRCSIRLVLRRLLETGDVWRRRRILPRRWLAHGCDGRKALERSGLHQWF